jgi:hypothetical protein
MDEIDAQCSMDAWAISIVIRDSFMKCMPIFYQSVYVMMNPAATIAVNATAKRTSAARVSTSENLFSAVRSAQNMQ